MADETTSGNGNARFARIEADTSYLRRDLDGMKVDIQQRLERMESDIGKRLEKIEANLSRVVWILIAAVIAAVLAQIGLA